MIFSGKRKKHKTETSQNDSVAMGNRKIIGKTFLPALFIGSLLILFSIIISDIHISDIQFYEILPSRFLGIVSIFLKNFGIALIIAYIFTFVSSTHNFIEFIRDKLINIMITKDFLDRLSNDERQQMLKTILKPNKEISSVYAGINDYFNKYITKSLSLFKTHFRGSYTLNAVARIDEVRNVVCIDVQIGYRMYKVFGEFERLNVGFEDENVEEEPLEVYSPDGTKHSVSSTALSKSELSSKETDTDFRNDPSLVKGSLAILPDELKRHDYLDIRRKITEYGNDHWHLFTLRTTQPCDKFSIHLTCEGDLMIKKYIPFGKINSFNIDCQKENKVISIFCNEWMEAGLGVAVLIAKRDKLQ